MLTPVGYIFVGIAALLMRQVIVGRVSETPSDIKDLVTALLNGDTAAAAAVTAKRGSNVDLPTSTMEVGGSTDLKGFNQNLIATGNGYVLLLSEVKRLGAGAKGYSYGAIGPTDYFDCSGLVWRAMRNLGIYTGNRFTTSTIQYLVPKTLTRVTTPQAGDIVVWPGHHMGVVDGANSFYSAKNPHSGIGEDTITNFDKQFGSHVLYRVNHA